jgi:hypothetical protein
MRADRPKNQLHGRMQTDSALCSLVNMETQLHSLFPPLPGKFNCDSNGKQVFWFQEYAS